MVDSKIREEILNQKYSQYISNHIKNVKEQYRIFMTYFHDQDFYEDPAINGILRENILIHDRSKYSEEEFGPYRATYYSIDDKEKEDNKTAYDEAEKHHYENNPHHWQHWYNSETGESEKIPSEYLAEMIIDWMAMGIAKGNKAIDYYNSAKDKMFFHPDTKERLEYLLKRL